MRRGFLGQRRHVQAAEHDEDAFRAVGVGERVRALRVGDVDLNHDEIGTVVAGERLHVLVDDRRLVVGPEVRGEGREAERRKERVFHRPPAGSGGFGQCRQDQRDLHKLLYDVE